MNAADRIAALEFALRRIRDKATDALAEGDENDAVYFALEDAQSIATEALAEEAK